MKNPIVVFFLYFLYKIPCSSTSRWKVCILYMKYPVVVQAAVKKVVWDRTALLLFGQILTLAFGQTMAIIIKLEFQLLRSFILAAAQ